MFYHSYNSYMKFGFPSDEVKPISCKGFNRDKKNRNNIGVNDVLGDYQLTLVDSIDMLVVLGDKVEFEKGIRKIIKYVNFNKDARVQVFEVTIRMLGGLLSGHMFASQPEHGFQLDWYNNELLSLALDLGERLLPAFYSSPTNIPFARVNLKYGMNTVETSETCTAGVGTLLLEFATLSRLTGDDRFEKVARDALKQVWDLRFETGLFGNSLDLRNGKWLYNMSGIGAGMDSFFEYLLKSAILLNDDSLLDQFESSYLALLKFTRDHSGFFYLNINANNTNLINTWIDSLAAFFPGLQVLAGDLENSIKLHLTYFNLWEKFHALPERFDLESNKPILNYYPLRPEFIESTYMLYQATRDPFYLKVGEMILNDLQSRFRCKCGFASMSNVLNGTLDDRMESFFLSETLKYLYLLFDTGNYSIILLLFYYI
ncbi:glycoside hydrolase [Neoconidiobolus thromboides FSU 785]|nr:glycoside hydrolase [Neoconidiobolus thromboides FSU 785]